MPHDIPDSRLDAIDDTLVDIETLAEGVAADIERDAEGSIPMIEGAVRRDVFLALARHHREGLSPSAMLHALKHATIAEHIELIHPLRRTAFVASLYRFVAAEAAMSVLSNGGNQLDILHSLALHLDALAERHDFESHDAATVVIADRARDEHIDLYAMCRSLGDGSFSGPDQDEGLPSLERTHAMELRAILLSCAGPLGAMPTFDNLRRFLFSGDQLMRGWDDDCVTCILVLAAEAAVRRVLPNATCQDVERHAYALLERCGACD